MQANKNLLLRPFWLLVSYTSCVRMHIRAVTVLTIGTAGNSRIDLLLLHKKGGSICYS